jgi:hypothetical protein
LMVGHLKACCCLGSSPLHMTLDVVRGFLAM